MDKNPLETIPNCSELEPESRKEYIILEVSDGSQKKRIIRISTRSLETTQNHRHIITKFSKEIMWYADLTVETLGAGFVENHKTHISFGGSSDEYGTDNNPELTQKIFEDYFKKPVSIETDIEAKKRNSLHVLKNFNKQHGFP